MKTFILSLFAFALTLQGLVAQSFSKLDKSPVDIAYFPDDFAHDRIFDKEKMGDREAVIRILYNRPLKKGREIFGKLVPYGKVWRTGANESVEIKLYKDVNFAGKKLKAGVYSLFTIPTEKEWTVIFNKDLDYWGAYNYKKENDALRVKASSRKTSETIEAFSMDMQDQDKNKGILYLGWDDTIVELPFTY